MAAAGRQMPLPLPKPNIPEVEAGKHGGKAKDGVSAQEESGAARGGRRHASPTRLRYRYYRL
jgi:hypothetical protein